MLRLDRVLKRVAVIKVTTHQGISCQDSSLISQALSNPPEITNLNEVCLANIALPAKEKLASNQTLRFFTKTAGCMKLPNIQVGDMNLIS